MDGRNSYTTVTRFATFRVHNESNHSAVTVLYQARNSIQSQFATSEISVKRSTGTQGCIQVSPHLVELEGWHRHNFGHTCGIRIVVDIHFAEIDARGFRAQFGEKGAYPSARRAPFGREVQDTLVSGLHQVNKRGGGGTERNLRASLVSKV